jgi:hypothetical protein
MTHRSLRFGRRNADVPQSPETRPAPSAPRPRREIFYGGQQPRQTPARQAVETGVPLRNYSSPEGLGGMRRHTATRPTSDGLTVTMPVVSASDATVVIPVQPPSRGRHALDILAAETPVLTAQDDPGPEVRDSFDHAIQAMATSTDPTLRRQAMAVAVRWFRSARDMARKREAWCDEADVRLRRQHTQLVEFNAAWDARLHAMAEEACGRRITSAGYGLAACYQDEGTAVTLGMVDEIKAMILRDALAGSGASR